MGIHWNPVYGWVDNDDGTLRKTELAPKPEALYDSPTRSEDGMARGIKRSELEIEAQALLQRLAEIISDLAQDRRRLEAAKAQLEGVFSGIAPAPNGGE